MSRCLALFLSLLGCSATPSGSATVLGTVGGQVFSAVDAMAGTRISGGDSYADIFLADRAGLCEAASRYSLRKSLHAVRIDLYQSTAQGDRAPSGPGTYSVVSIGGPISARRAYVEARTTDENCATVASQSAKATSGTVTLTRASNGSYAGTFDITLGSGDHLSGSFDAPDCPAIDGTTDGGGCG
jgi:hypothetical protein